MADSAAWGEEAAEAPIDAHARWAFAIASRVGESDRERLAYLGLGLASEAGELADHLKRLIRDGVADPEGFSEELGDIFYYWSALCQAAGRRPSELIAESRAKIEARLVGARS